MLNLARLFLKLLVLSYLITLHVNVCISVLPILDQSVLISERSP